MNHNFIDRNSDIDDAEIDQLLQIDQGTISNQPMIFHQSFPRTSSRENDSYNLARISSSSSSIQYLTNTLQRHLNSMPSHNDELLKNLQLKYRTLIGRTESKEGGSMSRTNSSISNQSRQQITRRAPPAIAAEQSESGDEQVQPDFEELDFEEEEVDDEEELINFDDEDRQNGDSPMKYSKRYTGQDSIKENDDGTYNGKNGADSSLFSKEQMESYMKLEPAEKLAKYKNYKQSFTKQNSLVFRKFFCEVLYDKIEEEKIIRAKYTPKVVGYILAQETTATSKYLVKLIDDSELRQKKIKEIQKLLADEESYDSSQIRPFYSLHRIEKFKEDLETLCKKMDEERRIQQENSILKDLLNRKQEITSYEDCEEYKELVEQIIIQKAKRIYNFSNSSKLIASFLLNLNLSSGVLIRYLLDSDKFQSMCNSAVDIIRVVSDNHKYEMPKSELSKTHLTE